MGFPQSFPVFALHVTGLAQLGREEAPRERWRLFTSLRARGEVERSEGEGRCRESELRSLSPAEAPPHPDLLPARGEKERVGDGGGAHGQSVVVDVKNAMCVKFVIVLCCLNRLTARAPSTTLRVVPLPR